MVATATLLCCQNECRESINNFLPSIFENMRVKWQHGPLIELSAAFRGKNAYDAIVMMP
jgi:hypothetical protein